MQIDILHPQASLEWRECRGPPVDMLNTQSVCLEDKVYVRQWTTLATRDDARLYIYTPTTDTWDTVDTPVYGFALTTYHSQLVLVGGREYVGENIEGNPSNKLWTLGEGGQWWETLPPMDEECWLVSAATSHGNHLIVTSGSEVNVCNGSQWMKAQTLPKRFLLVNSIVIDGHWYLMGVDDVFYASLDSLVASCQSKWIPSMWKQLPGATGNRCFPTIFGSRLIAVGQSAILAYSYATDSWKEARNIPVSTTPAPCATAITLSSDELLIIKAMRNGVFRGILKSRLYCRLCMSWHA